MPRKATSSGDEKDKTLYEVMSEVYGYNPQFRRGDLITADDVNFSHDVVGSDTPVTGTYDLVWAAKIGAVREAPEYAGRLDSLPVSAQGVPTTVQQLLPDAGGVPVNGTPVAQGEQVVDAQATQDQNAAATTTW